MRRLRLALQICIGVTLTVWCAGWGKNDGPLFGDAPQAREMVFAGRYFAQHGASTWGLAVYGPAGKPYTHLTPGPEWIQGAIAVAGLPFTHFVSFWAWHWFLTAAVSVAAMLWLRRIIARVTTLFAPADSLAQERALAAVLFVAATPSFIIYAQYAYFTALLEYVAAHAKEMQAVVKAADDKTVADVLAGAEAGTLRNFLDGEYQSAGKIDVLAYRTNTPEYKPGTSVLGTKPGTASGPPEVVHNVDDLTKPVGTRTAWVPHAYLMTADMADIADKLRAHNIKVTVTDAAMRVEGEQFVINTMRKVRSAGYEMTTLDGAFETVATREFPAGSFYVDMAQPMANAAFYYLEPQARDGFVGWWVLDEKLKALGAGDRPGVVYPVFKVRRAGL
jgi:hypothetical protein